MRRRLLPFALFPLALLATACSDDDDDDNGGGGTQEATVDVLLTDAPADELLYFRAVVRSLRLERDDATLTSNLLVADVPTDLLALDGLSEWLVKDQIPADTYIAVVLGFDPAGYEAAAADGSPVTIVPITNELTAFLGSPVTVDDGDYRRLIVDVDLTESLTGDVDSGTLDFSPEGSATSSNGSDAVPVDEIKGIVRSKEVSNAAFTMDAFADGDLNAPLGRVRVSVPGTALLVQEDGAPFASRDDFFDLLVDDATVLEVHGALVDELVTATKIEVEDSFGSGGDVVAEIRGLVSDLAPGTSFELLIQEVKKGEGIVSSVLSGLGNPASITVGLEPTTLFFLEEDQTTTADALEIGQRVKVKFTEFASEPFPAFKVEIDDRRAEFEGFVTDVSGLPASFIVHLRPSEPAVTSGQVQSSDTDVTVLVNQSPIELKADGDPQLATSDVSVGLKVEVKGSIAGPADDPEITATRIDVFPGRLDDATVTSADPDASEFATSGGEVDDPFGGGIVAGPLNVVIAPGCVFEGDALTEGQFFGLFDDLGAKETLRVEIEGVASGQPNEIRAFVIDARVDD